jgi:hypothetical protein
MKDDASQMLYALIQRNIVIEVLTSQIPSANYLLSTCSVSETTLSSRLLLGRTATAVPFVSLPCR